MDYSPKTISIEAGGGDLNFEGLRGRFFQASYAFCYRFWGVSPGACSLKAQITAGFSGTFFEISSCENSPCLIFYLILEYMINGTRYGGTCDYFHSEVMTVSSRCYLKRNSTRVSQWSGFQGFTPLTNAECPFVPADFSLKPLEIRPAVMNEIDNTLKRLA